MICDFLEAETNILHPDSPLLTVCACEGQSVVGRVGEAG